MIVKYSLKRDGNKNVSKHFKVREFRSQDNADTIYIDLNLVNELEKVRVAYGKPIVFNSAYRTPKHNKRVGGVSDSTHIFGKAVDIPNNKTLKSLLKKTKLYVLDEGSWLHCDSRYIIPSPARPILKRRSKGEFVVWLQHALTRKGFKCIKDGNFGKTTEASLKQFQKRHGLKPDGIAGKITYKELLK